MSRPGERDRGRVSEEHNRRTSAPMNGMENSSGERRGHHWRSYKLIIDPALRTGSHKLYRYDGQHFSSPNSGIPPVDIVRDPRIGRLWTKYKETDLPVPKFKIDECYVGRIPPKEVTFARLNDNIREGFLTDMCKKFGEIEEVEILYNPKNKKHLGIAKVMFGSVRAAKDAVQNLHNTSVMGNIIHVELDPKGENRLRYVERLVNGSYTPLTLPVGEESCEVSPRSLAEALLACEPLRRLSESSSSVVAGTVTPGSTSTPLSLDTAYSSLRQETPQSQGTPHTPRPTGTPFSQDSTYSSRQGTPALQPNRTEGSGGYKSRRHETKFQNAYKRIPQRHYVHLAGGAYRANAEQSSNFKQHQPPEPPSPAFLNTPPLPVTPSFKPASFPTYQPPLPPVYPHAEPPAYPPQPLQRELEYLRPQAPPPSTPDFMTVRDRPKTPPMPEPPPEPTTQPTACTPPPSTPDPCPSPAPEVERNSLDSRIEMLLKEKRTKLPFLTDRGDSDGEVRMEGSPISSSSSQMSPIPPCPAQRPSRPSSTGLEDISPTPLPDSDEDEPIAGTASLMLRPRSTSPPNAHGLNMTGGPRTPTEKPDSGMQSSGEDMEISDDEMPGTPISGGDCAKGIMVNSALSPLAPQALGIPPPGFPPLPHHPQAGYALTHHHLGPHTTVPTPHPTHLAAHLMPPLPPYPGMVPMMPVDLMSCLPQWGSVHMSFQMQTQVLSRIAQSQHPYPYPHYLSGAAGAGASAGAMQFGGPYQPLSMVGTPSGGVGHGQQWPLPSMPRYNPTVPPPRYDTQKEDSHKATVDGVLMVIVKELKAIMKRDLNRKMVEVVAFRAFDEWWEKKERSAKATLTPVKPGEGKEEEKERAKPKETLSARLLENWSKGEGLGYESIGLGIGLRGAIRLPSFKVKRKEPPDPASSAENKRARPSTPVDDELDDEERTDLPADGTRLDADNSAAKRRHSRPVELDSEGEEEEEEEEETSGREELSLSDREEEPEGETSERLSTGKEPGDDEEEKDEESESEASSSSDSSDEEGSSSSKSGPDSSSSSSESSSEYDSSSEEEREEEEEEEEAEVAMEVGEEEETRTSSTSSSSSSSSSDEEEESEVKALSTPPGPPLEKECESGQQGAEEAVPPNRTAVENLRPPSPKGLPVEEQDVDVDIPKVEVSVEDVGTLRPLTPTGSLADSDLDVRPKSQSEEEVPRTPGRDGPAPSELDTNTQMTSSGQSIHLPLPTSHALLPPPPDSCGRVRLQTDEEVPRTPGRDLRKGQSTETAPETPGSDAPLTGNSLALSLALSSPHVPGSPFSYPAQSPVLSAGIPRTPGRDLTFTPVFPDPAASSVGPLHRKASSDSLEEKPVFKEPALKEPPLSAYLPTTTAASLTLPAAAAAASPQELSAVPQTSPPASIEGSTPLPSTDQPIPLTEIPVPLDVTPSKKKAGRAKAKKPPTPVTPEDALPEPPPVTPSLPPEPPVKDLFPDRPDQAFGRPDAEPQLPEPEPDTDDLDDLGQTVLPPSPGVHDDMLYEPVQKTRRQRRSWEELLLSMHSPAASPPRPSYVPRSEFEEMTILYDIWNDGIDEEDIKYLKITYDKLLQQDNVNDWLNDTLWVHHPTTSGGSLPGLKKKRREDGMRDHVTGCARSEGYYKIDKKDKLKYLISSRPQFDEPDKDTQGKSIPAQPHASTRAGSERRSEQRRLLSSFSCDSDLLKFNQLKFRKKKIRFCKSHIHDWGLFAMEPIAADEMVIEYVGQNIRQVIADMREKRYEEEGIGSSYMFRVDHDTIIDATKCGNFARFINHSCNPNCYAKVITVESQKKIVIYSRQPINVNEEITYDYKFPIEDEKIPCLCGAENCRGTLN
ncbi:histone-lysine N-methyltransferase SETD1B-A isoform X1 [Astyanax mexicanus]|uniref:histone-lysine N-methyltransferase SETD1B-A isoform X1 n=1 Tax=Astyanax mexicanus TaxID=7994 RepID=UPI0020CB075B|nr:histone-lysine N-methyltransferase SETD1B-A isoform X1 [Astyanax mexicanus]